MALPVGALPVGVLPVGVLPVGVLPAGDHPAGIDHRRPIRLKTIHRTCRRNYSRDFPKG